MCVAGRPGGQEVRSRLHGERALLTMACFSRSCAIFFVVLLPYKQFGSCAMKTAELRSAASMKSRAGRDCFERPRFKDMSFKTTAPALLAAKRGTGRAEARMESPLARGGGAALFPCPVTDWGLLRTTTACNVDLGPCSRRSTHYHRPRLSWNGPLIRFFSFLSGFFVLYGSYPPSGVFRIVDVVCSGRRTDSSANTKWCEKPSRLSRVEGKTSSQAQPRVQAILTVHTFHSSDGLCYYRRPDPRREEAGVQRPISNIRSILG